MSAKPDPWKPDLADRITRLEKVKPLAGAGATPIIARAERLCDLVDDADGIRPDRQELIAALIFDAEADGKKLAAAWARYRVAAVHAALVDQMGAAGAVDLTPFKRR